MCFLVRAAAQTSLLAARQTDTYEGSTGFASVQWWVIDQKGNNRVAHLFINALCCAGRHRKPYLNLWKLHIRKRKTVLLTLLIQIDWLSTHSESGRERKKEMQTRDWKSPSWLNSLCLDIYFLGSSRILLPKIKMATITFTNIPMYFMVLDGPVYKLAIKT